MGNLALLDQEGLGRAGAVGFGGEVMEPGHDVGDVVLLHRGALVVQGEAIGPHVVEPDLVRAAVTGLGEDKDRGGHAGIGLEHAGGHGDHGLQPVVFDELLADGHVGLGGAEEDPVRHDAGAAAAGAEHAEKQGQEEELRLLGPADLEQVGGDDVRVQAPLEGGIGQDQGILVPVRVLVGEAVPILDKWVVDAVGHHVHGADAEHGPVHVEAMEHVVEEVVLLPPVEEDGLLLILLQILPRRHQEAGGAAGRVADHLLRAGVHELHHHADDVAGGAELAVDAGGGDLGEDVFVHVALGVGVVHLLHEGVDAVHAVHDLGEHEGRGDLEDGVVHILGVGAVLVPVEVFDEGEYPLLDHGIHLARREVVEGAPLELLAGDRALADLHLVGKNALIAEAQHGRLLGAQVVGVVQVADEHEVGHLLYHIQRIRDSARPEDVPQGVHFVLQFAGDHTHIPPVYFDNIV